MAYRDFKDLARRTAFDKDLRDKTFNIAKNPKYDGHQKGLLLWFKNFLIKSRQVVVLLIIKPLIKKFEKTTTEYSEFKDNIWGADLAYM